MSCIRVALLLMTCVLSFASTMYADISQTERLQQNISPLISILSGQEQQFDFQVEIEVPIDGKPQKVSLRLIRLSNGDYEFAATHADYSFILQRTASVTNFVLPHHQVVFSGKGALEGERTLNANGILSRLISADSIYQQQTKILQISDPQALAVMLTTIVDTSFDSDENEWCFEKKVFAEFSDENRHCKIVSDKIVKGETLTIEYKVESNSKLSKLAQGQFESYKTVQIPRDELEYQLLRGVSRATEILSPTNRLTNPPQVGKSVEHGELKWIDGQRVCILSGTPQEVGEAHGKLLKEEALKTIDSVLYTFGTVNTIRTGRWFRHDLIDAYKRLAPHIPADHKAETASLAVALEIEQELAQTLNVFPELFHCSGFAVFGSATKDGKLYHGRVLDYMTTIGLQDAATNFIVSIDGKIPFVNVGYAGFIGSVTGMNDRAISLGEMGGRGEGEWDGVPMATLMRRALEECSTLDEVKALWKNSPRTCEYYYVFADGKTNEAVGVAATPETIEFIEPGQGHERLGEGIPDTVVLSAGSRLEKLRERVLEKHGQIDEQTAIWLMSRPVAMESNLHNALFVPEDGILYVANADHKHPAAERPYVKIDLKALLRSTTRNQSVSVNE